MCECMTIQRIKSNHNTKTPKKPHDKKPAQHITTHQKLNNMHKHSAGGGKLNNMHSHSAGGVSSIRSDELPLLSEGKLLGLKARPGRTAFASLFPGREFESGTDDIDIDIHNIVQRIRGGAPIEHKIDYGPDPKQISVIHKSLNPREDTEQRTVTEEMDYREHYGVLHNKDSVHLGNAMFPQVIVFKEEEEFKDFHTVPTLDRVKNMITAKKKASSTQAAPDAKPRTNQDETNTFRALSTKFVALFLELFGFQLCWIKTKKGIIDTRFSTQYEMPPALFRKGATVVFFCNSCFQHNYIDPVVIAKCEKVNASDYVGDCVLSIEEVFYHKCHKVLECQARNTYIHNGFSVQKINVKTMFEGAYDKAVVKINSFQPLTPIIDSVLSSKLGKKGTKDLIAEVLDARGVEPLLVDEEDYIPVETVPQPPGHRITFGQKAYDFDNRYYIGLPTVSKEYEVAKRDHIKCIARLGYYLHRTFDLGDEFAPFEFDYELMDKRFRGTRLNWRKCFRIHKKDHLRLHGIALLFGGQEVRMREEPIHQWVHRDFASKEAFQETEELFNKFVPGSLVITLQEKRALYMTHPDHGVIEMEDEEIMVFRGDKPHGGMTRRDNDWDVSIHAHIDSIHLRREKQKIIMESNLYFPWDLMEFQTNVQFFTSLEKHIASTKSFVLDAGKRKRWLKTKTNKKSKKYQKILKQLEELESLDMFKGGKGDENEAEDSKSEEESK
jgi:hypothetical protein